MGYWPNKSNVHQYFERPRFNPKLSNTKTQKWYLMPSCLSLIIIRYGLSEKWSNLGCSSYWKGDLRVTLDQDRQLISYKIIPLKEGFFMTFSVNI